MEAGKSFPYIRLAKRGIRNHFRTIGLESRDTENCFRVPVKTFKINLNKLLQL